MEKCRVQWNYVNTIKMIKLFEEQELLWDPSHEQHRNRKARKLAQNTIADKMGISIYTLLRRYKTLRDTFVRERTKIENGCVKKSSWFAYDAMKFLNRSRQKRKNNYSKRDLSGCEGSMSPERNSTAHQLFSSINQSTEHGSDENDHTRNEDIYHSIQNMLQQKDDAAIFGEYIADKIRSMDQKTRAFVENELNLTLFKAEMGCHRN